MKEEMGKTEKETGDQVSKDLNWVLGTSLQIGIFIN